MFRLLQTYPQVRDSMFKNYARPRVTVRHLCSQSEGRKLFGTRIAVVFTIQAVEQAEAVVHLATGECPWCSEEAAAQRPAKRQTISIECSAVKFGDTKVRSRSWVHEVFGGESRGAKAWLAKFWRREVSDVCPWTTNWPLQAFVTDRDVSQSLTAPCLVSMSYISQM